MARQSPRLGPAAGAPLGGTSHNDLTVSEVLAAFWRHAERHYRTPGGKPSSELNNFKDTFRPLNKVYSGTIARQFSPLKLKALRQSMIESGPCRNTINQRIGRIVHAFKWAASEELVPASVHQALKTMSGVQRGRTDATESEPVRPVPCDPSAGQRCWSLRKADGTVYHASQHTWGAECDCPDFVFHRDGRDLRGCQHTAALRALDMLDNARTV
jgi:hypothetical protein